MSQTKAQLVEGLNIDTSAPADALVINSSGNVGIGTSPDSTLELAAGPPRLKLTRNTTASTGNDFGRIVFENSVGTILSRIDCESTSGNTQSALTFSNGGSERLRIDTSGRLLVGTSSLIDSSTASTFQIANVSGPRLAIGRNDTSVTDGNLMGAIDFYGNDSNGTYQQCARILAEADATHSTSDKPTRLTLHTTEFGVSGVQERVRITSNGLIGINENNPGHYIDMNIGSTDVGIKMTSSDAGAYIQFADNATSGELSVGAEGSNLVAKVSGSERLRIDSSGRLLVGTTTEGVSGGDQFTISATGHSGMTIRSGTSNRGAIYFSDGTSGNAEYRGYIEYDQTDDYMRFGTGGAQRVRIDSSGNVGINNSSPGSYNSDGRNLVVGSGSGGQGLSIASGTSNYGTIYFADGTSGDALYRGAVLYNHGSDFMRLDTAAGERMRIDSSGNVGIGSGSNIQLIASGRKTLALNGNSENAISFSHSDTLAAFFYTSSTEFRMQSEISVPLVFRPNNSEGMRLDTSGRLLVGKSSSSKNARIVAEGNSDNAASSAEVYLQRGTDTPPDGSDLATIHFADNTGAAGADIRGRRDGGTWSGSSKPGRLVFSTTANGASSPTERMRIRSDGFVNAGGYLGTAYHRFNGINASGGDNIFVVSGYQNSGGTNQDSIVVFASADSAVPSSATSILRVYRHASNQRSINAAGSINASGNDYAEYMTKAGNFTLAKGDVCGINSEGKLTNVFADAISFVVKSTDPSYVGGDSWHKTVGAEPGGYDDDRTEEEIAAAKVVYEEALEAARQLVDRIAFSGQVPVNVTGAAPGQYIVPVTTADGGITGGAKNEADLTLAEYMQAVGKVIAIEDDGRAKIIVKVA